MKNGKKKKLTYRSKIKQLTWDDESNLVVDVESGRIVQVIISSGGFLGMGETLSPVPPGALQHQGGQNNPSIGHQQREIRWSTQM